jgi:hypothetical protein
LASVRVLALALLLPLAQAVAAAHIITDHGAPQQRDESGSSGLLDAPCALCLSATPLHGGALPCASAPTLPPPALHAAPPAAAPVEHTSADALAYQSRAPPIALF